MNDEHRRHSDCLQSMHPNLRLFLFCLDEPMGGHLRVIALDGYVEGDLLSRYIFAQEEEEWSSSRASTQWLTGGFSGNFTPRSARPSLSVAGFSHKLTPTKLG